MEAIVRAACLFTVLLIKGLTDEIPRPAGLPVVVI